MPPIFLELDGSCHCGAARWTFSGELEGGMATACNCTLCRRYGALWAYGWEGKECSISGPVSSYKRVGKADPALEILFCTNCACVLCWRGLRQKEMENNRHRIAVNLRLAEPERISSFPVTRFDGLDTFDDLALEEDASRTSGFESGVRIKVLWLDFQDCESRTKTFADDDSLSLLCVVVHHVPCVAFSRTNSATSSMS